MLTLFNNLIQFTKLWFKQELQHKAKPSLAYCMDLSELSQSSCHHNFLLWSQLGLFGLVTTCILLATSKIKEPAKISEVATRGSAHL